MATSTPASPLALVSRITTAVLTAAAVGAGFVAVHLAGDRSAATASSTTQQVIAPQSPTDLSSQDQGPEVFAPVAPLGGGSVPQGATRGS